jgi:hypothetical protein
MNLSKAVRKQLIGLDLVQGVIDGFKNSNSHDVFLDPKLRVLSRQQQFIRGALVPLNEDGSMDFLGDLKKARSYAKDVYQARQKLLDFWQAERLDGREYLSAVLLYLDEIFQESKKLQPAWNLLIDLVNELYWLADPELDSDEQMQRGEQAGELLVGQED